VFTLVLRARILILSIRNYIMKNKKPKDIFKGCFGIGWIIIVILILAGIFAPEPYESYIYVLFFFVIGGLCMYNFSNCGRVHCRITGWGFIGVGVLALLVVLGIIDISFDTLWIIFFIVVIVGYGYEYFQKGKTGTCYTK